jgi:hypothetical protein
MEALVQLRNRAIGTELCSRIVAYSRDSVFTAIHNVDYPVNRFVGSVPRTWHRFCADYGQTASGPTPDESCAISGCLPQRLPHRTIGQE